MLRAGPTLIRLQSRRAWVGDRQGGRSAGRGGGQQLLGGLAEIACLPHAGGDLLGRVSGGGGHRPDGQLLGQAEVDAGELRRDQALAEGASRPTVSSRSRYASATVS
jgi:hypothetical protein